MYYILLTICYTTYLPYPLCICMGNQESAIEEHIQLPPIKAADTFDHCCPFTKLWWSIYLILWFYISIAKICSRLYKGKFAQLLSYWFFFDTLAKLNSSCSFLYVHNLVMWSFVTMVKTGLIILWLLYVGNGKERGELLVKICLWCLYSLVSRVIRI